MAHPVPSSLDTNRRLARVRQSGTRAEIELRRAWHARGLRYRVQLPILRKPHRVADIVFTRVKVAVFVDGCFWHGCPVHATWPNNNAEFWKEKIQTNRAKGADTNIRLKSIGWEPVQIWEHDNTVEAADQICRLIQVRRTEGGDDGCDAS